MVPYTLSRVSRCAGLLARARVHPASLRFEEACTLAECFGWAVARQRGSHRIFTHPNAPMLNLQNVNGMAKPYQVHQLVAAIDDLPPEQTP